MKQQDKLLQNVITELGKQNTVAKCDYGTENIKHKM